MSQGKWRLAQFPIASTDARLRGRTIWIMNLPPRPTSGKGALSGELVIQEKASYIANFIKEGKHLAVGIEDLILLDEYSDDVPLRTDFEEWLAGEN